MADYKRIIQRQALREAEGYLDLAMGYVEQEPLESELQLRLAQRALNALERLEGTTLRQPRTLHLTGLALRSMHRYSDAVAPLTEAARREPENISIWLTLAWCHKRTGHLDMAIESLENALAVEAQEAILHYNLACYWSLAGNPQIALRYLAQSFDIDPNFRELVAQETDFDPIRDLPDFQSLTAVIV